MGGNGGGPKILLAKPGVVRGVSGDDESASSSSLRSIAAVVGGGGSINLLSDSADFLPDRFLPFLTDNTDFTVVGVIGPAGVGKSTIMNELYGFDGTSPGMLPPLAIQSEEIRAQARHCTVGIEPRITAERIILLDTQPVFSPSVLVDIIRPDGSSTVPVLNGEFLSAELALELMGIQVDLLKHGIPNPSSPTLSLAHTSSLSAEKESKDKLQEAGEEFMATPVFVHTKLRDQDLTPHNEKQLEKALAQYFGSSSFMATKPQPAGKDAASKTLKLFLVPCKSRDDSAMAQHESYISALWKLRDQVLSMNYPSFGRTVSERDWLKNSAKIWDLIKNSSIIAEYARMLQTSGLFRR